MNTMKSEAIEPIKASDVISYMECKWDIIIKLAGFSAIAMIGIPAVGTFAFHDEQLGIKSPSDFALAIWVWAGFIYLYYCAFSQLILIRFKDRLTEPLRCFFV